MQQKGRQLQDADLHAAALCADTANREEDRSGRPIVFPTLLFRNGPTPVSMYIQCNRYDSNAAEMGRLLDACAESRV